MIIIKWTTIRKAPKKIREVPKPEITKFYVAVPGIQMLINAVHLIAIMKFRVIQISVLVMIFMVSVV